MGKMEAKPTQFRPRRALTLPWTCPAFTLISGRVQGVYKGCSPGVHRILAGTPDGHPLYTPCTRLESRVFSRDLDYGVGCLKRPKRGVRTGARLLSSVKTASYETKAGKRRLFKVGRAFGWLLPLKLGIGAFFGVGLGVKPELPRLKGSSGKFGHGRTFRVAGTH